MNFEAENIAAFVPRVILGILFVAQGFDKLFNLKIKGVVETFERMVVSKGIPRFLLVMIAVFTSYVEFFGGLLLVAGWLKLFAFAALGLDLVLVSLAFSVIRPVWDLDNVFPRLVLLVYLSLVPTSWDIFSVDFLFTQ